ncbi:(5-formylfuran-3-yl)methyl phosphate synthase [Aquabacterium sp. OR-4]|uniref:(5-formylfuran-3-yl)methyl phosphate synthase n=1 Tax=Aquabacterium sp. OR-4 TaxID=2978127 RepID=UPI0021B3C6A3|nr:(5-formylfuran-3-yl)methyl phosphate synthase [Aquabacterium sp. OR-4]MDT7838288.1 (5-formylfuran-3-yl)methyl phosphate synthase [Aquabacterium sp. OR-4]
MHQNPPLRLLVSVRSVDEARLACAADIDYIDLKEPGAGALGGLPLPTVRAVSQALRAAGWSRPVSATIGDLPLQPLQAVLERVAAVADCGVDYVKVGIPPGPGAAAALQALAAGPSTVVPVFIAEQGLPEDLTTLACSLGFAALMADTADKLAGSLLDCVPRPLLQAFVARARAAGVPVGLAGALRASDLPAVQALGASFAGFRSAVCAGHRAAALDAQRLQALRQWQHGRGAPASALGVA